MIDLHRAAQAAARFYAELETALRGIQVSDRAGQVLGALDGLSHAIDLILTQTGHGGTVFFIGNGASAAIASHQAADFLKAGRMRALAFNDAALLTALGNDLGYARVFEWPVAVLADVGDLLIAISSSGRSENILRGVEAARARGCAVLTLSGFEADNPLRSLGDLNLYVPARSYGHVEIVHLSLLHALLDVIVGLR